MVRKYRPHIPESLGELMDQFTSMLLESPTFLDKSGYFPEQNLENSVGALTEGLGRLRPELGDDLYRKLVAMSDQMRDCFEADPEDKTGETRKGKRLVLEMEKLVEARIAESSGTAD
jgi:hypothetical protein